MASLLLYKLKQTVAIKAQSPYIKTTKKALTVKVLCFLEFTATAQQNIVSNVDKAHKTSLTTIETPAATYKAAIKLDTVECLFHQLINDKRPLLTWRKGYVVLEDEKLMVGDQVYPKNKASYITGMIKNQFLAGNRKKTCHQKGCAISAASIAALIALPG